MKRKNPYPGLRPFEFSENALFFGREGQSEEVLSRLQESRFVAVVGTSGSGKSSLIRAGLLPLLYGGLMTEAGARWRVALFRPGDDPIHSLAHALVHPKQFSSSNTKKEAAPARENESLDLAITETVLRRSAVGLRDYANGHELAADEKLLVVVDQFEELFRFKKENPSHKIAEKSETRQKAENDASAFVKLLLEAARDESKRVYVVITMRSDFLGDCSQFRDLPEIINKGQYLIPRLTTEQLRKAIESPARVKKARIEPALCARLLNDIGDDQDQLPVLQHALMRTWEKWSGEGEINFANYNATGGMATALSIHANEAYDELGDPGSSEPTRKQEIAEKLFKCLTETDRENRETRRATPLGVICDVAEASLGEVVEVIDVFRRAGRTFLMPPITEKLDENSVIDISHESLIRKWDKLKAWVEEEAQASYTYRRLSEDARLHQKDKAPFWSDPQLSDALDWKEKFKPNETWAGLYYKTWGTRYLSTYPEAMEFLAESETDRNKKLAREKRRRIILICLTVLFFTTTIIAGFAAYRAYKSEERARRSEELVRLSKTVEEQAKKVEEQAKKVDEQNEELRQKQGELTAALKLQEKATEKAEVEKNRADDEAKKANELAVEAKNNLEEANRQKHIADNLRSKAEAAAESSFKVAQREQKSRFGQIYVETGEYDKANERFQGLLKEYQSSDLINDRSRETGIWWAYYNLANISWKVGNFENAQAYYEESLRSLGKEDISQQDNSESLNSLSFRSVSYSPALGDDYVPLKVASLRKLGQLLRERTVGLKDKRTSPFDYDAIRVYEKLLSLLPTDQLNTKFATEVKLDLADALADREHYRDSKKYYYDVVEHYYTNKEYDKVVPVFKKMSKAAAGEKDFESARDLLLRTIEIQEKELALAPDRLEIADTYDQLIQIVKLFPSSLNIEELTDISNSIKELNYVRYKSGNFTSTEIDNLARAYSNFGNCDRAEEIFNFANDKVRMVGYESDLFDITREELNFDVKEGEFFQKIRHDDRKAQIAFDRFYAELNNNVARHITHRDQDNLTIAADFYIKIKDFEKAHALLEKELELRDQILKDPQLRIIATSGTSETDRDLFSSLVFRKARILRQMAQAYAAQNRPGEVTKKYSEAIDLITKELGVFSTTDASFFKYIVSPTLAEYMFDFGEHHEQQGRTAEALAVYRQLYKDRLGASARIYGLVAKVELRLIALQDNTQDLDRFAGAANRNLLKYPELLTQENAKAGEYYRYSKNMQLTPEYYNDLAESYERLAKVEPVNSIGHEEKAREAREKEKRLKQAGSPCR